jgi:hypothetical protein
MSKPALMRLREVFELSDMLHSTPATRGLHFVKSSAQLLVNTFEQRIAFC